MFRAFPQHRFRLIFVEFVHDYRLRKINTGATIRLGNDPGRVELADPRAGIGAGKNHTPPRPILAQQSGLRFTVRTELVIVALQK